MAQLYILASPGIDLVMVRAILLPRIRSIFTLPVPSNIQAIEWVELDIHVSPPFGDAMVIVSALAELTAAMSDEFTFFEAPCFIKILKNTTAMKIKTNTDCPGIFENKKLSSFHFCIHIMLIV